MGTAIENAIKAMAEKAKSDLKPSEALEYAQATLNLAHAYVLITNIKK